MCRVSIKLTVSSNLVAAQGKLGFLQLYCSCSSLCNKQNERVKQRIAFKNVGKKLRYCLSYMCTRAFIWLKLGRGPFS